MTGTHIFKDYLMKLNNDSCFIDNNSPGSAGELLFSSFRDIKVIDTTTDDLFIFHLKLTDNYEPHSY